MADNFVKVYLRISFMSSLNLYLGVGYVANM